LKNVVSSAELYWPADGVSRGQNMPVPSLQIGNGLAGANLAGMILQV